MTSRAVSDVPQTTRPRSWRRPVFFGVSALCFVAVIVVAHEVMLPFILALLIAYVLTPLVAWAERRKVHSGVAILLAYIIVLGSIGGFLRLTAPRLGAELVSLRRDVPAMANELRDVWLPEAMTRLRGRGILPAAPPPTATAEEVPAIVVKQQADGSYSLDVGSGVEIVPSHQGYVLKEAH